MMIAEQCEHEWVRNQHPVTGYWMPFCRKCGKWDVDNLEPGTGRHADVGEFAPSTNVPTPDVPTPDEGDLADPPPRAKGKGKSARVILPEGFKDDRDDDG